MLGVVNTSALKYFLEESYQIEKRTEFIKSIQSSDDDEVTEALIDNELQNMFLFRIDNDPGLHYHVISEAKTDKDLLEKIHSIILQLYGKTVEFDKIFEEKPADLVSEYTIDYLQYRLKTAIDESESNEKILAINNLLDGYDRNKCDTDYLVDNILCKHVLPNNPAKLSAKCHQYIAQNIRYSKMYSQYSDQDHEIDRINGFFSIYNSYFSFYKDILSTIFRIDTFSSEVYDSFSDFERDLETIIHAEWFLSLERKEKIECLNKNYPFNAEHVRSLMTERNELVGINSGLILYFIEKMLDTGRIDLASEVSSFIENDSEENACNNLLTNASTKIRNNDKFEFEVYDNEIKCFQFERAKKLAEDILNVCPDHPIWHKYVILSYELCAKEDRKEFCNNQLRSLHDKSKIVLLKLLLSMSITEFEGKITDEVKSELKNITENLLYDPRKFVSIFDSLMIDIFPIIAVWKNDANDKLKISFLSEVANMLYRVGFSRLTKLPEEYLVARVAIGYKLSITAEKFLEKSLKKHQCYLESSYYYLIYLKGVLNKTSEAKKLGDKALRKYPDSILIRISMSKLFLDEAEYDYALKYLNEAKELMRNTDESQLTEKIRAAGENVTNLRQMVESLNEKISSFKGNYISFHKIKNKSSRAYYTMMSGDDQYFEKYRALEHNRDYSSILILYGKGIEWLLDDIVTNPLRKCIKNDKSAQFVNVSCLKTTRSLSLGQWKSFYKDLSDPSKIQDEGLRAKLRNKYDSLLSEEDRIKLENYCAELSQPRNGAAHMTFNSKEDVDEQRKKVVDLINSIIAITAKIPSQ